MSTPPAISEEGELRSAVFSEVTGVHLMCQIFMNDLLTEQGQQRSRAIRSPVNGNQIQLITLELSDLGHRVGSFSTTQYFRKKVN